jgi:hypothetical protein
VLKRSWKKILIKNNFEWAWREWGEKREKQSDMQGNHGIASVSRQMNKQAGAAEAANKIGRVQSKGSRKEQKPKALK